MVKKSFAIYGAIEKIEIFRDTHREAPFAHVTFKDSRTTYLALIDSKQNPHSNVEMIRPADVHRQPDNPIDSSKSPFYNLPDECLLVIFGNCDFNTLAALTVVCRKFCHLLRDSVFSNEFSFNKVTTNSTEVTNALVTVNRLVQCVNPVAFHVKIYRNIQFIKWPSVSVDLASSEKNKLSIDVSFFKAEWLIWLEPIAKRIISIFIRRTVYDKCLPYHGHDTLLWPNTTVLIVRGFSMKKSVPNFTSLIATMPNLEIISLQNLLYNKMELTNLYAKKLQKIYFEKCTFESDITKKQIIDLANVVRGHGTIFPLCISFDRIQFLKQQHANYTIQFELDEDPKNYDEFYNEFKNPELISIIQESTYSETMSVSF